MARVELEERWHSRVGGTELGDDVEGFLREEGMRPTRGVQGEITFEQGSHLRTRVLGGWFISAKALPSKGFVKTTQSETGTEVHARIEERMGVGVLDSKLRGKYEEHFRGWMERLKEAFPPE